MPSPRAQRNSEHGAATALDQVERPFSEIGSAIDELPPGPFRDYIEKAFAKSSGSTSAQTGPIAPGFGHAGGGVQTLLPLTVDELCALGVIREVLP